MSERRPAVLTLSCSSLYAQSAVAGSGTEQEIFRKTSTESDDIKVYCHAVEEYFHAFLNPLSVLSISHHCAVTRVKNLDCNSLTEGVSECNSGEWISILASLCNH